MSNGPTRDGATAAAPDLRAMARAFGQSPSAIAVVAGAEHIVLYANAALHELVANNSTAVRAGAPLLAAFGAPTAHVLCTALDSVRAGGRSWRGVVPIDGNGGDASDRWPCMVWALDNGSAGEPSAILVEVDASTVSTLARLRVRDLTERVLLSAFREEDRAEAADAARATAEKANAARRQFIAAMSHDLRTPLQAIGGYARLFEMGLLGPVTDRQQNALIRIHDAMEHVLGLATELLAQERIEAGELQFASQDIVAATVLREAASLVQTQADAKGLRLGIGACRASLVVRADAGKLRQVLVNLLNNAVKFTAPGDEVTATCEAGDTGGAAWVAIRVRDTGQGIPADQLTRVFEPYVQVGRALSMGDTGVGLGLAISRAFAKGMGGTLTVESTVGRGSTFTLTLPRVKASEG